ncbi:MAG: 3-dehydroquinate synthase [Ktedonobacterales bacterium]
MLAMETAFVERIFLIGPSGAGKTTVAERVAALLGWSWVDTDAMVQEAAGRSIPAIFADVGETGFRELEDEALAQAAKLERTVVATGAGICENLANLSLMHRCGRLVTLAVSAEAAYRRLGAGNAATIDSRPMLAGNHPLESLRLLDRRRRRCYAEADETIFTDDLAPEIIAARVVGGVVGRGLLSPASAEATTRCVETSHRAAYDSVVAWGGLATLPTLLQNLGLPPRLHVISDTNVAPLYEPVLMSALMRAGFTPLIYRAPAGEASKSREQLNLIQDWLAERRAERREALLAFGGGVVCDLGGFAAATYLRGIPLLQVPTSLLAQVDASIGGKVGINHPLGKNLIGAFYQPRLVLADPALLLTMPRRELTEGWAEVIKHGVTLDAGYFAALEREAPALLANQPEPLTRIIARSVSLKAGIVEADERERDGGRRHLLNYGHTIGHAIEAVAGYGLWLHGEAVAAGMVVEAGIGHRLGITPGEVVSRLSTLLERFGLPTRVAGLPASRLLAACLWDKKVSAGRIRLALPTGVGKASLVSDIDEPDILAALLEAGAEG